MSAEPEGPVVAHTSIADAARVAADYLRALPPRMQQQARLLENDFGIAFVETGQFCDVHRGVSAHAAFSLPVWLLDDWGMPAGDRRSHIEQQVLAGTLLTALTLELYQSWRADRDTDIAHAALIQSLAQRADVHFTGTSVPADRVHAVSRECWHAALETFLWETEQRRAGRPPSSPEDMALVGRKTAPLKIGSAVAALAAGRDALVSPLLELIEHLNVVYAVRRDFESIRRDAAASRWSYPLARALRESGLDATANLAPEQVLGALALSGTLGAIAEECALHLRDAEAIATTLRLPSVVAHLAGMRDLLGLQRSALARTPVAGVPAADRAIRQRPSEPTPEAASRVAEAFLFDDPGLREAWEVQRLGVPGGRQVIAQAFPVGLVLEQLAAEGHDVGQAVSDVFGMLANSRFAYFPFLWPDADTLGMALRLFPFSQEPDAHADLLATPLRWLSANIGTTGEVPVWFTRDVAPPATADGAPPMLYGHHCSAVESSLLLGLCRFDGQPSRSLIERCLPGVLDRWSARGLGGVHHYVPGYAAWVMARVIRAAGASSLAPRPVVERALATLRRVLIQLSADPAPSPQHAAFLTLACLDGGLPDLLHDGWRQRLLESQRFDGSWRDEPLYLLSARPLVTGWYSSRLMTTAFCYRALRTSARHTAPSRGRG